MNSPELDELIFKGLIIQALILIRKTQSCGIPEAMEIFDARYNELRKSAPERFLIPPKEYGKISIPEAAPIRRSNAVVRSLVLNARIDD